MTNDMTWLSRFFDKVDTSGECWEWTGALGRGGYGLFGFPEKYRTAHRGLWEAVIGPLPEGYELDHLCRNTRCIRFSHLEPVTRLVNIQRSMPYRELTAFAATNAAKEACDAGHPLTEDNVYRIPGKANSGRYCKACHVKQSREWDQRRQAKRVADGLPTHCARGHEYVEGSFYTRKDRPNSKYCRVCKQEMMVGNSHGRKPS